MWNIDRYFLIVWVQLQLSMVRWNDFTEIVILMAEAAFSVLFFVHIFIVHNCIKMDKFGRQVVSHRKLSFDRKIPICPCRIFFLRFSIPQWLWWWSLWVRLPCYVLERKRSLASCTSLKASTSKRTYIDSFFKGLIS